MKQELPIPGYHGYYATADGQIISYRRGNKRRELIKTVNTHGYEIVSLYDDHGHQGNRYVHQLVLEAHGFMRSIKKDQVRHKNGVKTDNRLMNIEWCDQVENYKDRVEHKIDVSTIRQRFYWSNKQPIGTGTELKIVG